MLRDVNTIITDGGLGVDTAKGEGIHFKIGVSPVSSDVPIIITGNMDAKKIKEKLGLSPLADACMDSVENGSNMIYCLSVRASVPGTVGEIEKTGVGLGKCIVEGQPNNAYEIIVKFTGSGGFNQAVLRYSVDGGYSFSEEVTLAINGELDIPSVGLKFKFAEDEIKQEESFKIGDTYTIKTESPQMTNQDVLTAIDKLRTSNYSYEYVHIVGESTKALWAAVSSESIRFTELYKKPLFFVLEARNITEDENLDEYAQYIVNERKGLQNYDIQIVTARSLYTRMDGTIKDINNAGIVCGLYSKSKVQQSIGEVKSFSIPENKMLELLPKGIEDYLAVFDETNYLTFRKYEGIEGFYVTNARMMCPEGSDYKYAERVRVKNKIMRETRKRALKELQSSIDMTDVQGSLEIVAKFIQTPLDTMARNKEISSARIIVPEGQDILADEKLNVIIRFVPIGHFREIEIDLGMENPFRNQQ
ncbi:DUF2586 domain-containing protein [Tissierella carlieri]|uniref:DUF2586 domain-containing protein n=1 Tax=Tissierella carlieri TaxID=689904 RepID=UPI001C0F89A8|nr:DUF2586 domain-containing protein [Tissierella carlieri]MBU5312221.1 DUF2586 domain-containing protein [Tissierella carlieri]